MDFSLILGMHQEIIMVIILFSEAVCTDYKTNKLKKLVILQPLGIIVIKSKEKTAVTYTCKFCREILHQTMYIDHVIKLTIRIKGEEKLGHVNAFMTSKPFYL